MKRWTGVLVIGILFLVISSGWVEQKVVKKDNLPLSCVDGIAYYSRGIGQDSRDVRIVGFPLFLEFTNARVAYRVRAAQPERRGFLCPGGRPAAS